MTSPIVLLQRLPVEFDYELHIKQEILMIGATDSEKHSNHIDHKKSEYKRIKKKSTIDKTSNSAEKSLNLNKNTSSILSSVRQETTNVQATYQKRNTKDIITDELIPVTNGRLNFKSLPMVILERLPIKLEQSLVHDESLISDETILLENIRNKSEASETEQRHDPLDSNNFSEINETNNIKFEIVDDSSNVMNVSDNQFQEDQLSLRTKLTNCAETETTDITENEMNNVLNSIIIKEENEIIKSDEENSFGYNPISKYDSNSTENRNRNDLPISNAYLTNTLAADYIVEETIHNINNTNDENNCNIIEKNRCKSISLLEACKQIAAYDNRDLLVLEQDFGNNELWRDSNESDNELSDEDDWSIEKHKNLQSLSEIDSGMKTNIEIDQISNKDYLEKCKEARKNLYEAIRKNLYCEVCANCNIVQKRLDKVVRKCYSCDAALLFQCLICKSQYKYISGIRKHVITKHLDSNEDVHCPRCNQQFTTRFRLQDHLRFCKIIPYLKCRFCPMRTTRKSSLKCHLLTRHRDYSPIELMRILDEIVEASKDLKEKAVIQANNASKDAPYTAKQFTLTDFIKLYCGRCDKVFKKILRTRQRNCSICDTKLQMQCYKCERRYNYRNSMAMHLKTSCARMFNVLLMKCNYCNYLSCSKANLTRHIERVHSQAELKDIFSCSTCGKQFGKMENLKNHQLLCGKESYLSCDYCTYKTIYESALKHHMCKAKRNMLQENGITEDNDEISSQSSIDTITLHCQKCNHQERVTQKVNRCKICNTSFDYRCILCNEIKINFEQLRLHLTYEHSGNTYYDCLNGCGKSYAGEYTYREHTLMCNKEPELQLEFVEMPKVINKCASKITKPVKNISLYCKECGKCYKSRGRLEFHISRCELFKTPLCCEHCSFRTVQKNNLINHIQSKHAARLFRHIDAFQCEICSVMFKNYFVYSRHVEDCRPREKKI